MSAGNQEAGMAKKVAGLDSPAKRGRLAPSKNPYWLSVGGSRSGEWLGYRRAVSGPGTWVAKVIVDRRKVEARIAAADDVSPSSRIRGFLGGPLIVYQ
jgi:hypothetical protein